VFGKKKTSETVPQDGFLKRLRTRLNRGSGWLSYDLANLAPGGKIDEETLEDLETGLIMADVGVEATEKIIANLEKRLARRELGDLEALTDGLRQWHRLRSRSKSARGKLLLSY